MDQNIKDGKKEGGKRFRDMFKSRKSGKSKPGTTPSAASRSESPIVQSSTPASQASAIELAKITPANWISDSLATVTLYDSSTTAVNTIESTTVQSQTPPRISKLDDGNGADVSITDPSSDTPAILSSENDELVHAQASDSSSKPAREDLWQKAWEGFEESDQEQMRKYLPLKEAASKPLIERMDDLVRLTQDQQKLCDKKRYKFEFHGHTIITRDVVAKIVTCLDKFKTIGDVAVSYSPEHAALPWAGIRFLLQAAVGEQDQAGALLLSVEQLATLTGRCTLYEALYRTSFPPSQAEKILDEKLEVLYTTMLKLISLTLKLFAKSQFSRGMKAVFDPTGVTGLLEECGNCEKQVEIAVTNCHRQSSSDNERRMLAWLEDIRQPTLRFDKDVQKVLRVLENSTRMEILQWVSNIQYGSHHQLVSEKRTPDTCKWLVERELFQDWQGSSESVILWLQGSPGTGKTYLTSKVIDRKRAQLQESENSEGFAYFYCNRNESERRAPEIILRSFVRQLSTPIQTGNSVHEGLCALHVACRNEARTPSLEECKKILTVFLDCYPRSTIVLDALDECEEQSRKVLIGVFDDLIKSSHNPVKIFVSSRPEVDITNRFKDHANIRIRADDNDVDIKRYLACELPKHAKWKTWTKSLQEQVQTMLERKAAGMFQWVFLQVKQLQHIKVEKDVRKRLGQLPKDLEHAYREIIENMEEEHKSYFRRACMWIIALGNRLESEFLLEAVCQDDLAGSIVPLEEGMDEKTLLEYCHNLLIIDTKRKVWIPSHLSVIEYLEVHMCTPQTANTFVTTISLLAVNDMELCQKTRAMGWQAKKTLYPYAAENWHWHLGQVPEPEWDQNSGKRIAKLLKQFLGAPFESSQSYKDWSDWQAQERLHLRVLNRQLQPSHISAFAICRFGLYTCLLDRWQQPWPDIHVLNKDRVSFLGLAVQSGNLAVCEKLIHWGLDVNQQFEVNKHHLGGSSPLAVAAYHDQIGIMQVLIDNGARVDLSLDAGDCGNALVAAATQMNLKAVNLLIEAGADINAILTTGIYGNALAAGAYGGDIDVVRVLLDAGADVNAVLIAGDYGSVLSAGAYRGGLYVVSLLLDAGADVNAILTIGNYGSALAAGARGGDIYVVRALLDAEANVNVRLEHGMFRSALHAARNLFWVYENPEVMELLLDAGAVDHPDYHV